MLNRFKEKFIENMAKLFVLCLLQTNVQYEIHKMLDSYLCRNDTQEHINRMLDNYLLRRHSQGMIDRVMDVYFQRDLSKSVFKKALSENHDLQKEIWKATNIRPMDADMHWAAIPNSIRERRMVEATIEAGRFVHEHLPHLEGKPNAFETLRFALNEVTLEGLYLEFGVFSGTTISFIAGEVARHKTVHGFDSFEGLPEQWGAAAKGTFDTRGQLPPVPENVVLHKGWFDQTIGPFLAENTGPVAFLHADADLYSSTRTILTQLAPRIVRGTIIVFDEYFNYPYWRDHEYRAFMEFIEAGNHDFEYIAYTDRGYSVAVRII